MDGVFARRVGHFRACPTSFSFFDLVDQESLGPNKAPLHRLLSLMRKMGVNSLIMEDLEPSRALRSEIEAVRGKLASHRGKFKARARRFTFSHAIRRSDWNDANVLGFLVLLTVSCGSTRFSYVYSAAIRLPCVLSNSKGEQLSHRVGHYYLHCSKVINTTVGTRRSHRSFSFRGNYFNQQNGLSSVCGHVAFCMAFNNSPHYQGKLIYPHQLANGTHGIGPLEMSLLAGKRDFHPLYMDFGSKANRVKYDEFVYPLIESGFPVVLGIKHGENLHAVAAMGHTLNTDRWSPEARLRYLGRAEALSSSAWVDHLLLADDNLGPLLALPAKSQDRRTKVHVSFALGFVPAGIKIPGYLAEQYSGLFAQKVINLAPSLAGDFGLGKPTVWLNRLAHQPLVLRTILLNKADYLKQVVQIRDQQGNKLQKSELELLEQSLPDIFWLTEVTIPHLYTANKHKLGEFFTDASAKKKDAKSFRALVFGWLAGLHTTLVVTSPRDHGFSFGPWSLRGHVPLLRTKDGEDQRLEW